MNSMLLTSRRITLLILGVVMVTLCSCTRSVLVSPSDIDKIREINQLGVEQPATIWTTHPSDEFREYEGFGFRIEADSALWSTPDSLYSKIPLNDLIAVRFTFHGRGALEGLAAGTAVGAPVGALIGLATPESAFLGRAFYVLWGGLIVGIIGGVGGTVAGAVRGSQDIYILDSEAYTRLTHSLKTRPSARKRQDFVR